MSKIILLICICVFALTLHFCAPAPTPVVSEDVLSSNVQEESQTKVSSLCNYGEKNEDCVAPSPKTLDHVENTYQDAADGSFSKNPNIKKSSAPFVNQKVFVPAIKEKLSSVLHVDSKNTSLATTGKEKMSLQTAEIVTEDLQSGVWLWAGVGINYVDYSQSINGVYQLTYDSIKAPTFYISSGMHLDDQWAVEGYYKYINGEIDNSSGGQGVMDFDWNIISFEGLYKNPIKNYKEGFLSNMFLTHQLIWRVGLQQHVMPFLNLTNSFASTVDLIEFKLLTAHAGFSYLFNSKNIWSYELILRYQYPILSSSEFSITPSFAFDGSVSATYRWSKNISLGFFWYGQWQSFDYTYKNNSISSTGKQELFFSNVDVRIGYEF